MPRILRTALRVVQIAAVCCAVHAAEARADVMPPNLRPCEGAHDGQPCETDACTPGTCRTTPKLLCKQMPPGCAECTLLERDGGASCDEACVYTLAPCVLCFSRDPARDADRHIDRWSDCLGKGAGDACKTVGCEDGACEPHACDAPPCPPGEGYLVCAPPRPAAPSTRVVLAVGGGLVVLIGGVVGALARRRRRRR